MVIVSLDGVSSSTLNSGDKHTSFSLSFFINLGYTSWLFLPRLVRVHNNRVDTDLSVGARDERTDNGRDSARSNEMTPVKNVV